MYRIITGSLLFALLTGCGGRDANNPGISAGSAQFLAMRDTARFTTIQWLDSSRDYGKIPEGQKLDVSFRFRNTGPTPLVIGQVHPSCGCTVAQAPREPIAPGGEGQIKASFNSDGRVGINHKSLLVTTNTKGTQNYSLQFVVEVLKKS
ncbi:MAG TPA: DUF1573 domain-containing protein [Puia sp.]|uniref:DUF1573 domain-containing protein n=1 Tax=Puia sp. TaxID=2045100 RepID=UPI002C128E4D|nr:DUF1573 domain-containing protein [Puia sp.]HVU96710.1 DUF1573 domain-containing protein [Puia sp.]